LTPIDEQRATRREADDNSWWPTLGPRTRHKRLSVGSERPARSGGVGRGGDDPPPCSRTVPRPGMPPPALVVRRTGPGSPPA